MELSYIAGFNRFSGKSNYDQDTGVQVPTSFTTGATYQADRTNSSNYTSSSHELDLKSTGEQTIDWILGAYYAAEDNNIRFDIPILNGTPQGTVSWQGSFIQPKETVKSTALFGQATWNLSEHWRLTGGARWSHDKKENVGGRGWGWDSDPTVPQYPISPDVEPSPATGFAVSTYNDAKYSKGKVTWLARLAALGWEGADGILYENGDVRFQYDVLRGGGVLSSGTTVVGIESPDGSEGVSLDPAVLAESTSVLFSADAATAGVA